MSSEDKSRKTEEPTPHKLRKAREKGEVNKSKEVTSAVSLCGTLVVLLLAGGYVAEEVIALLSTTLDRIDQPGIGAALHSLYWTIVKASAPIVATALVFSLIAAAAQVGFLPAPKAITPDFNRLNPVKGFQRMFGRRRLLEVLKAAVKIVVIGVAVVWIVRAHMPELGLIHTCGVRCGVAVAGVMLWKLLLVMIPLFAFLAVIDQRLQRKEFLREQRMTKEEMKREHRDTQGSPEIKGRRRSSHRESVNEPALETAIAGATMLVTDGRALVGIRKDAETGPVPLIVVREKGNRARKAALAALRLRRPIFKDDASLIYRHSRLNEPARETSFDVLARALLAAEQIEAGEQEHEGTGLASGRDDG